MQCGDESARARRFLLLASPVKPTAIPPAAGRTHTSGREGRGRKPEQNEDEGREKEKKRRRRRSEQRHADLGVGVVSLVRAVKVEFSFFAFVLTLFLSYWLRGSRRRTPKPHVQCETKEREKMRSQRRRRSSVLESPAMAVEVVVSGCRTERAAVVGVYERRDTHQHTRKRTQRDSAGARERGGCTISEAEFT